MQPVLVATKFILPPVPLGSVARPRLLAKLDGGSSARLILVSAQAGSGKTTLAAEWIRRRGGRAAWISLDEGDNDLARFWACLATALQSIFPAIAPELLGMFQFQPAGPGNPQRQIEAILTGFINAMSAETGEIPGLLVLDDLHLITQETIFQALAYLIERLPAHLHIVILTRVDPPLPLARLRARQQLIEIRADDLRFTTHEIAEFLTQRASLHLSDQDMASLEARTEGWAVGLQMAALAMQKSLRKPGVPGAEPVRDIAGFIQAFSGSHRYVLDYLLEEVLSREPDWVQSFLVQTSILRRMCGRLCDAVTGRADSQAILERLEAANLFVVPLDDDRQWYRYHHLFADLLVQQLHRAQPELLPALHRQASQWYTRESLLAEAVQHAFAAQDFDQAAELIEKAAFTILARNEINTLMGWLAGLPEAILRARPWLCVLQAWMLILTGQAEAIEGRLRDAEETLQTWGPENPDAFRLPGYIAAIRAQVAFIRGQAAQAIEFGLAAQERLTPQDAIMSATTAAILGAGQIFLGNMPAATDAFKKAKTISQNSGNLFNALLADSALAQIAVIEGRLREAHQIYRDSITAAEAVSAAVRPPVLGYVYVGLANVLREWNDLVSALRYASEGVELCKLLGQADILLSAYQALARVQQAYGEVGQAMQTIREGLQAASELSAWSVEALLTQRVCVWLATGDLEAAEAWVRQSGLNPDDAPSLQRHAGYLTLAHVLMAQGEAETSAGLLARLAQATQTAGRVGNLIETQVLQAVNFWRGGGMDSAMETLRQALILAEPQGYVRVFLDEGQPMQAILEAARQRSSGAQRKYVEKLLQAFRHPGWQTNRTPESQSVPGRPNKSEGQPDQSQLIEPEAGSTKNQLIQPLSERELEVLRLLALGRSNPQIADRLVVSLNTVKAHLKNIYAKLNAHNRTEAVQQARALRLL